MAIRLVRTRIGALALAVSVPALSNAQSAPGTTPSSQSAVSFDAASVTVLGQSYRLLLQPAREARRPSQEASVRAMRSVCGGTVVPGEAPSQQSLDSERDGGSGILIVATAPATSVRTGCEARWDGSAPAIWHGLSFDQPASELSRAPSRIQLVVNGDTLAPLRVTPLPALRATRGAWVAEGERVHNDYPLSAMAPVAGRWPSMTVILRSRDSAFAVIPLFPRQVQTLALGYLKWQLTDTVERRSSVLALRPVHAQAPAMQGALLEAERGNLATGALRAAEWLGGRWASEDSTSSDAVAKLLMAEAFAARGDTTTAAMLVDAARVDHRCLRAPNGASIHVRRLVDERRRSRCAATSTRAALLAGIVVPGGGHALMRNRLVAAGVGGVVLATLSRGASSLRSADRTYQQYLQSTSNDASVSLYMEANALRQKARVRFITAATIWAADAVVGAAYAAHRSAEVRRDQQ